MSSMDDIYNIGEITGSDLDSVIQTTPSQGGNPPVVEGIPTEFASVLDVPGWYKSEAYTEAEKRKAVAYKSGMNPTAMQNFWTSYNNPDDYRKDLMTQVRLLGALRDLRGDEANVARLAASVPESVLLRDSEPAAVGTLLFPFECVTIFATGGHCDISFTDNGYIKFTLEKHSVTYDPLTMKFNDFKEATAMIAILDKRMTLKRQLVDVSDSIVISLSVLLSYYIISYSAGSISFTLKSSVKFPDHPWLKIGSRNIIHDYPNVLKKIYTNLPGTVIAGLKGNPLHALLDAYWNKYRDWSHFPTLRLVQDGKLVIPTNKMVVDHLHQELMKFELSVPDPKVQKVNFLAHVVSGESLVKDVNVRLESSRAYRNNFSFGDKMTHNMFASTPGVEYAGDEVNRYVKYLSVYDRVYSGDADNRAVIYGLDNNQMMEILMAKGKLVEGHDVSLVLRYGRTATAIGEYWKTGHKIPLSEKNATLFFLKCLESGPKQSMYSANVPLYDWIAKEVMTVKPATFVMSFGFPDSPALPLWLERIASEYRVTFFRVGREHNSELFLHATASTTTQPKYSLDMLKGNWRTFIGVLAHRILRYNAIRDQMVSGGYLFAYRPPPGPAIKLIQRALFCMSSVAAASRVAGPEVVNPQIDFSFDLTGMSLETSHGEALPPTPASGPPSDDHLNVPAQQIREEGALVGPRPTTVGTSSPADVSSRPAPSKEHKRGRLSDGRADRSRPERSRSPGKRKISRAPRK